MSCSLLRACVVWNGVCALSVNPAGGWGTREGEKPLKARAGMSRTGELARKSFWLGAGEGFKSSGEGGAGHGRAWVGDLQGGAWGCGRLLSYGARTELVS